MRGGANAAGPWGRAEGTVLAAILGAPCPALAGGGRQVASVRLVRIAACQTRRDLSRTKSEQKVWRAAGGRARSRRGSRGSYGTAGKPRLRRRRPLGRRPAVQRPSLRLVAQAPCGPPKGSVLRAPPSARFGAPSAQLRRLTGARTPTAAKPCSRVPAKAPAPLAHPVSPTGRAAGGISACSQALRRQT